MRNQHWLMIGEVSWKDGVGTKTEAIDVRKQLVGDKVGVVLRTTSYSAEGTTIAVSMLFIPDINTAQLR